MRLARHLMDHENIHDYLEIAFFLYDDKQGSVLR
jgi:hypothetical protein